MFLFSEVARFASPGDNVAIATRKLEAGSEILLGDQSLVLDHTVLEGHRFAIETIPVGQPLLSWGMPFGLARLEISPGQYVCNRGILEALAAREIDAYLPIEPNFEDFISPISLDKEIFRPAGRLPRYDHALSFEGYRRGKKRGVGTRNMIILLGTSSLSSSYVKNLAAIMAKSTGDYPNIDGIVAVSHTEGGNRIHHGVGAPNNLDLVLRTLAGFMVHPNVGAVLAVDYGQEVVNNERLRQYMIDQDYPLDDVLHNFMSIEGDFDQALLLGEAVVKGWTGAVNGAQRTTESLADLKIALQCGGSDAFSGVSGNPLAATVAKEIIRYGGAANMAETPELVGAEAYVLDKVRALTTAQRFLETIERFKAWTSWHGLSVEGNPSGGNKLRGLYNITLKSLGAAMKRHPDVPLDGGLDYAEPMPDSGFYFMDSPGLDLESIAGQVASGCNLIFFVTGNGSITNFPFVPTIKVVTTTGRYEMLLSDMDVNAGQYLDGTPMEELSREMLSFTIDIASGQLSAGEKAGHAQVQIWRDWVQTSDLERIELRQTRPGGRPIPVKSNSPKPSISLHMLKTTQGLATDHVGLILPTSLCSVEVARMVAERLNQAGLGRDRGLSRFVALVHTEGCSSSSKNSVGLFSRLMAGYATHPMTRHCLFLEHGCEVTHNDFFRRYLLQEGLDPTDFGWASVQSDGGIEPVMQKIGSWFVSSIVNASSAKHELVGIEALKVGIHTAGKMPDSVGKALAQLAASIAGAGGTVVLPDNACAITSKPFQDIIASGKKWAPTLAYGQKADLPGLHVMESQTRHWVETLTGLGATGVEVILAYSAGYPIQGHPMIPVIHFTDSQNSGAGSADLVLDSDADNWPSSLLERIGDVMTHRYTPRLGMWGNVDFQITRGYLGISL